MAHVTVPVSAGPNVFESVPIHVPTVPVSASDTFGPALNTGPKDVQHYDDSDIAPRYLMLDAAE